MYISDKTQKSYTAVFHNRLARFSYFLSMIGSGWKVIAKHSDTTKQLFSITFVKKGKGNMNRYKKHKIACNIEK